jgi:RNA polymerase sigma-70 factor (ECF subfamily)
MVKLSDPETSLIASAKAGDIKAFDALVELHQRQVFALAYRMLGNKDDADDVQQETFVRAWRKIGQFRGGSAFATWLHRIAANLCLSRRRRVNHCALDTAIENELDRWTEESNGFAATLVKSETAAQLQKALAGLPGQYRIFLVLRHMEERSFEEIAEIVGCSVASAWTRTSKARRLLRERMGTYLAEDEL